MRYEIPKIGKPKKGRRFAIGDIHGCVFPFKSLLKKLELAEKDQLFLLGDLIDKGHESKEVVDFTIELMNKGFKIYPIRGNHEQSFLTASNCGVEFFTSYLEKNETDDFLENIEVYLKFFDSFEYAYDLGDSLVCHSEFLVNEKSIYRGMRSMFSNVQFDLSIDQISNKRQVIGHFVKSIQEIELSIQQNERVISIDSGCVYHASEGLGFLTALNLDTLELISLKNEY